MEHCARGIEGSTVLRFDIFFLIFSFQNLFEGGGVGPELGPLDAEVRED
jgi:hypothetical protein